MQTPYGRAALPAAAIIITFGTYVYISSLLAIPAILVFGLGVPIWAGLKRPRYLALSGLVVILVVAPLSTAVFVQEIRTPISPVSANSTTSFSGTGPLLAYAEVTPASGNSSTNFTWSAIVQPQYTPPDYGSPSGVELFVSSCSGALNSTTAGCPPGYSFHEFTQNFSAPLGRATSVNFHYKIGAVGEWSWQMAVLLPNGTAGALPNAISPFYLQGDGANNGLDGPLVLPSTTTYGTPAISNTNGTGSVLTDAWLATYAGNTSTLFEWNVTVQPQFVPHNFSAPLGVSLYVSTCAGAVGPTTPNCTAGYPLLNLTENFSSPSTTPFLVTLSKSLPSTGWWNWQMGVFLRNGSTGAPPNNRVYSYLVGSGPNRGIVGPLVESPPFATASTTAVGATGPLLDNAEVSPYTGDTSTNYTWNVTVNPAYTPAHNGTPIGVALFISACPGAINENDTNCPSGYAFHEIAIYFAKPLARSVNLTFRYQIGTNGVWDWQMGAFMANGTTGALPNETNLVLLAGDPMYNAIEGPVVGGWWTTYAELVGALYLDSLLLLGLPFYIVLVLYMFFKRRERQRRETQRRAAGPPPADTTAAGSGTAAGTTPPPPSGPSASAAAQEHNCPQCGAVLYAGETSCWKCGAKVGVSGGSAPLPSSGPKN